MTLRSGPKSWLLISKSDRDSPVNLVCQMPVYLQVWQGICTQKGQAATFLTEMGHMPLGEPEESLGLAVAFEKSIRRNGYGLCLKVLPGSTRVVCNLGLGLR